MILPNDNMDLLAVLGRRLDGTSAYFAGLDAYYAGGQQAAYLSPESLAALNGRLPTMTVNFCRLAVLSIVERLKVAGMRVDGAEDASPDFWDTWTRSNFDQGSDTLAVDALVCGRSYAIVWGDEQYGDALISAESPRQVATVTDPATHRVLAAVKRWTDDSNETASGTQWAVLYLPARVLTYATRTGQPGGAYPPFGGAWELTDSMPNPLGVVPVVPFVNGYGRRVLGAPEGESELTDLMPLVDALSKIMQDALVTSESTSRPRRWVTGLEVSEDENGNVIDLFSGSAMDKTRMFQAEHPETKFGQFPQADLSGYTELIGKLTEQISAVSALPGHYLGISNAQPPSADALRASEVSLVSRTYGKQRLFAPSWSRVGQLETAVRTGRPVDSVRAEPLWAPVESRSPSQDSDEASKLVSIGVPLPIVLSTVLGWSPELVASVEAAQTRQAGQRSLEALLATPAQVTPTATGDTGQVAA